MRCNYIWSKICQKTRLVESSSALQFISFKLSNEGSYLDATFAGPSPS